MQNKPLQWKALMQSYQRTNAIMPYAPHTHLRRLCKLIHWSSASKLDMPGQWVYMVWTVLDPRPYFGQCGAIGGPKTVIQRFSEEVTAARSCTVVYGNKRRRVPLFIYLLRKLSTNAFFVVPARRTTVSNTDHVEIWHIRHSVPIMNTNHTKRGQYYRWLARGNIRKCLPPTDIHSESRWKHYMNVNRVVMEPLDALRMLVVARKGLTAGKYSALQRKLIPFLKHTTKLQLP